ncbi:hypothetical protein FSP39_023521, partial [Pinctada imbricata]
SFIISAVKAVLDYLNRQNRPYSAIDICNNLHKEFGKTAIVKACESLAEGSQIKEKVYGKQKVYVADQSQFPDVDDSEIKDMDKNIVTLTQEAQDKQDVVKRLESGQCVPSFPRSAKQIVMRYGRAKIIKPEIFLCIKFRDLMVK